MLGNQLAMDLTQKFYITVAVALISFVAGVYVKHRNDKARMKCKWDDLLYKALIFQSLAVQTLFSSYSVNVANEAFRTAAHRSVPVSETSLYESYATVTLSGGRTITFNRPVQLAEGCTASRNTRVRESGILSRRASVESERLSGSNIAF
jgi:hypothetical protein